jgi:hypothetical protein
MPYNYMRILTKPPLIAYIVNIGQYTSEFREFRFKAYVQNYKIIIKYNISQKSPFLVHMSRH